MRKLLFFASFLLLAVTVNGIAGEADFFTYDATAIENQMSQLDQLEGYLLENPGTTLGMMVSEGNPLAAFAGDANGTNGFNLINEKVMGIPGFIWGCCLSWVGILVVYLVGKDPHETKQAIFGCVVGGLLGIGTSIAAQMSGILTNILSGGI